jgi:hypothetical protein
LKKVDEQEELNKRMNTNLTKKMMKSKQPNLFFMNYDIQLRGDEKDNIALQHFASVEEQIAVELKSGKLKNPLSKIIGQWPGDGINIILEECQEFLNIRKFVKVISH